MTLLIAMIVIFLALSGTVAAIDAAVLSVTRPEIEELVQQQRWGAKRLRDVKLNFTSSVVVVVIVTNTINVLGPIVISHRAFLMFDRSGVVMTTVVLTLGTIVFSEILPKAIGAHYAPRIARASAPALLVGRSLLYPLVAVLSWFSELLTPGNRPIGTEPQIRSLVRMGHEAGLIERDEEQLIHRVFVLNDRTAADIMTPLAKVRFVSASCTIHQAASEISQSEFSRYPIFGQTTNEILGIALSRDLLRAVVRGDGDASVMSLAKSPLVVHAATPSNELLMLFRDEHLHIAIVQRSGVTLGIVSLEDVLEELVGEIEDEKDVS